MPHPCERRRHRLRPIIYYSVFLHYCHLAMGECFGAVVGQPYHGAVLKNGVGYPMVRTGAEYLAPVDFGEVIRMQVIAEHVGTSSVRWRYQGRRQIDGVSHRPLGRGVATVRGWALKWGQS